MLFSRKQKSQKGQSLIYVAVMVVILVSSAFYVFDVGSTVNTKIKFQNGADSAALAGVAVKISKHHVLSLIHI